MSKKKYLYVVAIPKKIFSPYYDEKAVWADSIEDAISKELKYEGTWYDGSRPVLVYPVTQNPVEVKPEYCGWKMKVKGE